MNKYLVCAIFILMAMMPVTSCRMVEVSSKPRTFTLALQKAEASRYQVSQLRASGKFEPVKPAGPGIYLISIPAMDGGYKEFLFIRYNKHIPEEYPVVQVQKDGKVLKELSIRDMEKLPVMDGHSQLKPE
jgi:hypothetical protein